MHQDDLPPHLSFGDDCLSFSSSNAFSLKYSSASLPLSFYFSNFELDYIGGFFVCQSSTLSASCLRLIRSKTAVFHTVHSLHSAEKGGFR